VAIIMLVLIVRAMLHPITRKGQVNMMRMQQQMSKIQPKMEEIKKRYPNDKSRQSQEVMKIYQEAGVNPAGQMMSGCLPMFLQMPVWIALYTSLNFNIDMRHQPFLLWIQDLTSPDALIKFDNAINIPLLSSMTGPIHSFNLLPILVSAAMFAQQKLMPKPKQPEGQKSEAAEQAAQMQKIMPFMTLFFGLIFYNMPSGLNLYIGTSSFFGMLEQMHIRRHIEDLKTRPEPEKKKRKMPGFIQKIQKAAEDAQKIQSNKSKSQDGKHDGKHDGGSGKSKKRR
jgi:YidC/Oxa1 family membrane protein insertase